MLLISVPGNFTDNIFNLFSIRPVNVVEDLGLMDVLSLPCCDHTVFCCFFFNIHLIPNQDTVVQIALPS